MCANAYCLWGLSAAEIHAGHAAEAWPGEAFPYRSGSCIRDLRSPNAGRAAHLIPLELRPEIEKELGVRIEGNLCPACQLRLKTEYGGDIEQVEVERVLISEENRVGIGTFSPSDPKSQDIADLTGDRFLHHYGIRFGIGSAGLSL